MQLPFGKHISKQNQPPKPQQPAPVLAIHPDWLTIRGPHFRREFLRRDLFAARIMPNVLELFLGNGQCWVLPTLDPFALLSAALAAKEEIVLAAADHLAVSKPNVPELLRQRVMTLPRPKDWSLPAPWALLQEVALNLDWIEEMHQLGADQNSRGSLTLKTTLGVAFKLALSPAEAVPVAAAVHAQATFTCDELEILEIKLPVTVAYPRPLKPEVVTMTSFFDKKKW